MTARNSIMTIYKKMSFNTSLLFVLIIFSMLTHETLAYLFFPDLWCNLWYDKGPCNETLGRWWYNWTSGKCESFIYGGCKGNRNNFIYITDCIVSCENEMDYNA